MAYGKNIIIKSRGCEVAIVFDSLISHCDIGTTGDSRGKAISAGFFCVGLIREKDIEDKEFYVSTFGKSDSLGIESRKEDARLIKRVLRKEY